MNKILLSTILAATTAVSALAGVGTLNYQAVVYNNNEIQKDTNVDLKFEILDNEAVVYTEDVTTVSDNSGLVTCEIGKTVSLDGVDWSSSDMTLRVSINLGSGYTVISNSPITSVPTSLYALKSADTEALSEKVTDIHDAVEEIISKDYDEKFLQITADIVRFDDFIADADEFHQSVSDELSKLQGLDAEEIADFNQRASEELARLAEQTDGIQEAVEDIISKDYDEKFLQITADMVRFDEFIATADDFNDRVSEELTRQAEVDEDQALFNQSVSDTLAKMMGLDAEEIADFNQRVSDELARQAEKEEEQATFNQSVSDALAKLVGLDAEEIGDFNQRVSEELARLAEQTDGIQEAVEDIISKDYDEKFLQITADMVRFDEFITTADDFNDRVSEELTRQAEVDEEQATFNQSVSDALAKLVGLDAEEIGDFNQRVSEELARLAEVDEEQATFNQSVSDALAKLVGLDAEEIGDFNQRASEELARLAEQTDGIQEAVEDIISKDYDEKFLQITADMVRFDEFIASADEFNDRVSEELSKLQGLDATEIDDFHQRVSDELARQADADEEQATFNQSVSDALAKLVGLDAEEIGDFNQRVSEELARLYEVIEDLQKQIEELKNK